MSCCNQAQKPTFEQLWKQGYMALIITKEVQGLKPGTDVSHFGNAQKNLLLQWGAAEIVPTKTIKKTRKTKVKNEENPLPREDEYST